MVLNPMGSNPSSFPENKRFLWKNPIPQIKGLETNSWNEQQKLAPEKSGWSWVRCNQSPFLRDGYPTTSGYESKSASFPFQPIPHRVDRNTELRNHVFHKMTPPGFSKGRNLRGQRLMCSGHGGAWLRFQMAINKQLVKRSNPLMIKRGEDAVEFSWYINIYIYI